jgi:hypothetical protein
VVGEQFVAAGYHEPLGFKNKKEGKMHSRMEMPKYSNLVKLVAQIGAVAGVSFGAISCFIGLAAFKHGPLAGFSGIFTGAMTIIGSLASLGIVYCFLALVEAQIDTRNAILSNFNVNLPENKSTKNDEIIKTYKPEHIYEEERLLD